MDEAIEQLDLLLSIPASVTIPFVRNDPFMAPIVEDPRYEGLVEKYERVGTSEGDARDTDKLSEPDGTS